MDGKFAGLLQSYLPYAGGTELTEQSRLLDLGLDSMQAIELLFALEDEYGVQLPDDKLDGQTFETAGSLWATVRELCEPGVAT